MYGEEDIISAVIPRRQTTPHLCDFVLIDQAESIGERRDGRQKKMRRTQEEIS